MVTTLSLHQQNTVVSTLNVLLLTLNKALLGGCPRIARVSLVVRVKFSFKARRRGVQFHFFTTGRLVKLSGNFEHLGSSNREREHHPLILDVGHFPA